MKSTFRAEANAPIIEFLVIRYRQAMRDHTVG